jgi:hypothetical protein
MSRDHLTSIPAAAVVAALILFALPTVGSGQVETTVRPEEVGPEQEYSPYIDRAYPDRVLFGDTHFHTNLSFDAGLIGTSLTMDEGYRFARGEMVRSNTGQRVQLIRPLDFLVITDHGEFLGLASQLQASDPLLLADPWGARLYELFNSGQEGRMQGFMMIIEAGTAGVNPLESNEGAANIWRDFVTKADDYNEPGVFTAMTGFEWTSTPDGDNQHRVVIFGDGAARTSQTFPFTQFDSPDPEDLWAYLANYEATTGGRAMAVPHNGNLSNGLMFGETMSNGDPMTRAYAEKRIRWEPLHEMTQIKGDEETHPLLSPEDEFANFETWDVGNLDGTAPKEDWMLKYEYARSALKTGLEIESRIGVNPYKFGLSGASDTHTALATTREENYFGKYQQTEPSPERHNREVIPADDPALRIMTSQEAAAGLIGVWARENNRDEIFSSMRRKEVYATTGTRIRVRVFAGWEFEEEHLRTGDFVGTGYRLGVPMGSDLRPRSGNAAPRFMVRALRDPDGANLDRVQMIKGWIDSGGETHERIYDVAVSDGRTIEDDGRARQPVGNTVDIESATFSNTIGSPVLEGFWEDPEFDPGESAFYYVRVIEIPTPRWTTYDAAYFDIPLPQEVPPTVQDRAYTSPIWYSAR